MASHCLNASRPCRGGTVTSEVSASYSKTYGQTTFTQLRHRFAQEAGYRVAVNTESTTSVSFTGTLTNCLTSTAGKPTFYATLRYYNIRMPTHKHMLSRVSVSLPASTLSTGQGDWFVPFVLTGTASLPPGIYQFDVLVTPFTAHAGGHDGDSVCSDIDTEASDTESVSSSSSHDSTTDTQVPPPTYQLSGDGFLSIHVIRRGL